MKNPNPNKLKPVKCPKCELIWFTSIKNTSATCPVHGAEKGEGM